MRLTKVVFNNFQVNLYPLRDGLVPCVFWHRVHVSSLENHVIWRLKNYIYMYLPITLVSMKASANVMSSCCFPAFSLLFPAKELKIFSIAVQLIWYTAEWRFSTWYTSLWFFSTRYTSQHLPHTIPNKNRKLLLSKIRYIVLQIFMPLHHCTNIQYIFHKTPHWALHTTPPNFHRMFDAWNIFVSCGQGSSCRKVCTYIYVHVCQLSSMCALDSWILSNVYEHTRLCTHLTLFIDHQVILFSI